MTKKDLYFCLRCGMVRIGNENRNETAVGRVTVVNWDGEVVMDSFVRVPVPVRDYRTETTGITEAALQSEEAITFVQARARVETLMKGKILIGHGLEVDLAALGLSHPWCDVRDTANFSPYMKEVSDGQTVLLVPRDLQGLAQTVLRRPGHEVVGPVQEAICTIELYKAARHEWEAELIKLMQQKERQRELVMRMRSSGGGIQPQHRAAAEPQLSAIREDEEAARSPLQDGFFRGKRGRSFSSLPSDDHARGEASTLGSTVPTVPFTEDEDGCSDVSSYMSSLDLGEKTSHPPGLSPGFARDTGIGSSQIENLHEVLGHHDTPSYMHPTNAWSVPSDASDTSSLTSAKMDSWSLDDNRSSASELWAPSAASGGAMAAKFPADVRRPWPPATSMSSPFRPPSPLTEEQLLGPELLADLNDDLIPPSPGANVNKKLIAVAPGRKQSWQFLRRLSSSNSQHFKQAAAVPVADDATARTATTSRSYYGQAFDC